MEYKNLLVSLVAIFAIALFASSVSAMNDFGNVRSVEVGGVTVYSGGSATSNGSAVSGTNLAVFAGESLPVTVVFDSNNVYNVTEDVRVRAWISGAKDISVTSDRFDLLAGRTYPRTFAVKVPSAIDPSEQLSLQITVESENHGLVQISLPLVLNAQRNSYVLEVLNVAMDSQIKAGQNLALDVVLKNRGMHFAEDTFVTAKIAALGVERTAYFGDLSPVDQGEDFPEGDKEDAVAGRLYLSIPASAQPGIYTVEVIAENADSTVTATKRVVVVGASADSSVVSSGASKTLTAGEKGTYTLTLINTGNSVRVYELVFETPSGLSVEADESIIVVPAGSSKAVKITATADKAGEYDFVVNVQSGGQLVQAQNFKAKVEGTSGFGSSGFAGNATVVLTVVLAIIFIVLLIVLIVLLTRKPQKSEEFGESYY